jgi:hypothetical protein
MNADQDCTNYIEDTLLLKFLIVRYSEMLGTEEPNLDPVWSGLGMVALRQDLELKCAFETLLSSSYTAQETLTTSIDLFVAELNRIDAVETTKYLQRKIERRPLSPRTARKFLYWSWAEGRKMQREKNFRFYPIWEVVSWLAFTSDKYLSGFEEMCRLSDDPVEMKIQQGLEVIKAAIFRRDIGSTSFEQHMLKTDTTPNDKETQE